jgi:MOSC domain-containing protein YiiM
MNQRNQTGAVLAVCLSDQPGLPKSPSDQIQLLKDQGVQGDYHAGKYIRHRYLANKDPHRLNNRQVLLVDNGIHRQVLDRGIQLAPGDLGENILVDGIDLMSLEIGTRLQIRSAVVELTEVRDPCYQLDEVHPGLQQAVESEEKTGSRPRAGMLAVVLAGGIIQAGDQIQVLDTET